MTEHELRYARRASALWPGLDTAKLRRTQGDPCRIARLVARRTTMPVESILDLLLMADGARSGSVSLHDAWPGPVRGGLALFPRIVP